MTVEQENMIGELIDSLQGTDYQELENLAVAAYNKAIEDAIYAAGYHDSVVELLKELKIRGVNYFGELWKR